MLSVSIIENCGQDSCLEVSRPKPSPSSPKPNLIHLFAALINESYHRKHDVVSTHPLVWSIADNDSGKEFTNINWASNSRLRQKIDRLHFRLPHQWRLLYLQPTTDTTNILTRARLLHQSKKEKKIEKEEEDGALTYNRG